MTQWPGNLHPNSLFTLGTTQHCIISAPYLSPYLFLLSQILQTSHYVNWVKETAITYLKSDLTFLRITSLFPS